MLTSDIKSSNMVKHGKVILYKYANVFETEMEGKKKIIK